MALTARFLCLVSTLALAPCARDRATSAMMNRGRMAASLDTAPSGGPADASLDGGEVNPPASLSQVIDAVRREDFRQARERLVRLPEAVQRSREGRYLGGRIASALSEHARAAELLHGLGAEIPPLRTEIERLEASSLARAGRNADARALYEQIAARTRSERDAAQAAVQAQAQGDHRAALAVMRRWSTDPPAGIDRARAWRLAALSHEATGDNPGALRAWRRIVVDEPDAREAQDARAAMTRLGATLSLDEMLDRAARLNDRARYAESIAELGAIPPAQGAQEARRLHLYGRALFSSRGRYADAHTTLRLAAARAENTDRDEDAFLSARALARADRDDEAVVAYEQVARTVQGRWGDEAAFRAAWLHAHHERVEPAVAQLRAFLRDRTAASEQLRSEAAWELGWVLYRAGRFAEAAPALEQSSQIAPRSLEKGRGRYWAAMARLRAGNGDAAAQGFRALIAERPLTYYALLAETRLREQHAEVPLPRDPAERRPAPTLELPANVRWLRALGFEREGIATLHAQEDALRATLPRDRADEVIALAYMDLGDAHRAYALSQRHGDLLDHEPDAAARWAWDTAYPRPYAHWVEAAEDANHLPRHYLYAIMRQESSFNGRDVSSARAIGLLQMVPPTTRRVAQELGIEFREELLFEPEYNIRTGGHYIGRVFAQYRGVLPRAIGAFNGGPGAMNRWVTRWPSLELDAFVERIPFDETRTYVRRVLQNLARYRYLHGPRDANWPLRLSLSADPQVDAVVDY